MKVFGVGRFAADPVLQQVGDTNVCKFALAVNEYRKVNGERKQYAHFFQFEVWDKAAELIHKYQRKGDQIEFYGTARQQKWNDKDTGEPRERIIFRMDDFTFINSKKATVSEDSAVKDEEEVTEF